MKQALGVAVCLVVAGVGCNYQTIPEKTVQNSTQASLLTTDLVFNVEGLT